MGSCALLSLSLSRTALDLASHAPYDRVHRTGLSSPFCLAMKLQMRRLLLALLPLVLAGCLTTTALLSKSEFDERRAVPKQQIEKGLISKEAGETSYCRMLNTVDRNHAAPPSVDPAVCDFGSFADTRYELFRSVESGALTRELWVTKCKQLIGLAFRSSSLCV